MKFNSMIDSAQRFVDRDDQQMRRQRQTITGHDQAFARVGFEVVARKG